MSNFAVTRNDNGDIARTFNFTDDGQDQTQHLGEYPQRQWLTIQLGEPVAHSVQDFLVRRSVGLGGK